MQAEGITQRKYALVKVKPGDYLLPGNDRTTLWRITRYEDGKRHGLEEGPEIVTRWELRKWHAPISDAELQRVDVDAWELWENEASSLLTRAEAIEEAMRLGAGES